MAYTERFPPPLAGRHREETVVQDNRRIASHSTDSVFPVSSRIGAGGGGGSASPAIPPPLSSSHGPTAPSAYHNSPRNPIQNAVLRRAHAAQALLSWRRGALRQRDEWRRGLAWACVYFFLLALLAAAAARGA